MRLLKVALLWLGIVLGSNAMAQVALPAAPAPDPQNILHLSISTGGEVAIALRPDKAPGSVGRIKMLTRSGFYDGLLFHRVIEGFMAQTGDPKGNGSGGSPLPDLKAEFNDLMHFRGAVSMARTDEPNSANSQFFICFQPVIRLDGKYTIVGRVISGMQFVDLIERGEPPTAPSKIVKAWIEADGPNAAKVPLDLTAVAATPVAEAAPPAAPTPATAKPVKTKKKKKFGIF